MKSRCATRLLSLVFMFVLVASLAAAQVEAKETLTVYVPGNALQIYGAYADMAKSVAENLGYEISVVSAGTWVEYFEKILVHQASGMPVDLILMDDTNAGMYLASGMFSDLSSYVKADKVDLNQFFPMSVDIKRFKSQLMALPCNVGISNLYYNIDLLQGIGIADLPTDWSTNKWDWAEFTGVLRKATVDKNGDGLMDQVGLARWQHVIDPWLWGSDYVNSDASRSNFSDAKVTKALEETIKLYSEYSTVQGALAHVDKAVTASTGTFYKAQALFLPGLDADAGNFAAQVVALGNASKINATIFPKGTERHTTFNSWGWGVGSSSKNKDAAWKVIKGLTLDRNFIGRNAANGNRLPALRSAIPQVIGYLMEKAPINWQVVVDALSDPQIPRVYRWFFNKNGSQANTLISSTLSSITSGKKSPIQAFSENHEALDSILKEGAW